MGGHLVLVLFITNTQDTKRFLHDRKTAELQNCKTFFFLCNPFIFNLPLYLKTILIDQNQFL